MARRGFDSALQSCEDFLHRLNSRRLRLRSHICEIQRDTDPLLLVMQSGAGVCSLLADAEYAVGPDRLGKSLRAHRLELLGDYRIFHQRMSLVSDQDPAQIGVGLQA